MGSVNTLSTLDAGPERAFPSPPDGWGADPADEAGPEVELATVIGANLRRFRKQRGWSLEQFGRLAKVSRAMLGQIELSRSVPTITVLWKIARALDLPISALLGQDFQEVPRLVPAAQARTLHSPSGQLRSRALFPPGMARKVEFYELILDGLAAEAAEPQAQGVLGNLVACQGALEVTVEQRVYPLATGDALCFRADLPHGYRNPRPAPARMYLVIAHPEPRC